MNTIKNIAIITFDRKNTDLIEWSYFNKDYLKPHNIFAFGFAGNILEGTLNKKIEKSESNKLGESRYLCGLIKEQKIDALIIFGNADEIFNSKEFSGVFEEAVKNNIIVAANKTTADFLVHSNLLNTNYTISRNDKKGEDAATDSIPFAKAS